MTSARSAKTPRRVSLVEFERKLRIALMNSFETAVFEMGSCVGGILWSLPDGDAEMTWESASLLRRLIVLRYPRFGGCLE